jgi:hypothetical protein
VVLRDIGANLTSLAVIGGTVESGDLVNPAVIVLIYAFLTYENQIKRIEEERK